MDNTVNPMASQPFAQPMATPMAQPINPTMVTPQAMPTAPAPMGAPAPMNMAQMMQSAPVAPAGVAPLQPVNQQIVIITKAYSIQEFQAAHPGKRFAAHEDMKRTDGTPFTSFGINFGGCFVAFSKKVTDAFPGAKMTEIAKFVIHPDQASNYQIIEKPGIVRANGRPIYSLCPANNFTIDDEEI